MEQEYDVIMAMRSRRISEMARVIKLLPEAKANKGMRDVISNARSEFIKEICDHIPEKNEDIAELLVFMLAHEGSK